MNLIAEAQLILFEEAQNSGDFHPATCGGGGGPCSGVNLKARQVIDTDEIEMYCDNCNEYVQTIPKLTHDFIILSPGFKEILNKLKKDHREKNIKDILNNK